MAFPDSISDAQVEAPSATAQAYQAHPLAAEASQPTAVSLVPPTASTDPGGANSVATMAEPQTSHHPVDVASWAASALQSLSLSSGVVKGTGGVPLSIPLDQALGKDGVGGGGMTVKRVAMIPRPPTPKTRRDRSSLRRRDALLEGREGTRQRRRWENDHFKNVPNAQPPQPSDWVVQPTHPVFHVPYHLARCWDDIAASKAAAGGKKSKTNSAAQKQVGHITREVRESAKRNSAFKGWVRAIEEPVRWFVLNQQAATAATSTTSATAHAAEASVDSSIATLVSPPTSPGKDSREGRGDDMELVTDASDEEMVVFRGRGCGRTRENRPSLSLRQSMSISTPFACNPFNVSFRYREERKSVLSLQREEDWEELVPMGTRSRTVSSATSPSTILGSSGGYTSADPSSWRVIPSQDDGSEREGGPVAAAAMLFVSPDGSPASTYKRWIVHSVALYYGLYSASVNDSETMQRYVYVGPTRAGKEKAKAKIKKGRAHEFVVPGALWEQL